ncbi:MAG: tRNA pseudouridine(38-40) synthase TruA [Candidatus Nanopelagicaceae bacterium]
MNQPTLNPESGFVRAKITLAYDGTNFYGWGKQLDRRTVQGEIESVLSTLYRREIETVVAGRTDAGVHASGQVIHVDLPIGGQSDFGFEFEDLGYRLNRILTDEIRIKEVIRAPLNFHARFGALRRHYLYKIQDGSGLIEPVKRLDITPWYRQLDLEKMNSAASQLIGEHDFFSYAKYREHATTIRKLERFDFSREADGVIISHISADAFCYNMVRALIGTLVYIGEGRFPITWAKEILEKRERPSDSVVFPARGLTFIGVDYPQDSLLADRANQALGIRDAAGNLEDDGEN